MTRGVSVQLLMPAAGEGKRLGSKGPKALVDLAGTPLLVRTLRSFESSGFAQNAVIIVPKGETAAFQRVLDDHFPGVSFQLVIGGAERQDSVGNGLAALERSTEIVVIHDAARPFVSAEIIESALHAAEEHGAASVAIPCVDTVLEGDVDGMLVSTPDRSRLWCCQTPQVFRVSVIRHAHEWARERGLGATDDASMVRAAGGAVRLVRGNQRNVKITTPEDMAFGRYLIEHDEMGA